jgi:hypothetical protein
MDNIEELLQDDPEMQQVFMMSAIEEAKREQKARVADKEAKIAEKE